MTPYLDPELKSNCEKKYHLQLKPNKKKQMQSNLIALV